MCAYHKKIIFLYFSKLSLTFVLAKFISWALQMHEEERKKSPINCSGMVKIGIS